MPYDLFISYSRVDNQQGRITQLVDRIRNDFADFAGRPLVTFFDITEINGMDDWRHRILRGLRESRLLLTVLSPSYFLSEFCEWEVNEYLKHEIERAYLGEGIAPVYFVEVPGWEDKLFDKQCTSWVTEIRRRQNFDLRPWFNEGEASLRDITVQERMQRLNYQLSDRIIRSERSEHSIGNVDTHNPNFIGRIAELRRLREMVALGKVGVLTVVHGLGGVGKTSLVIEYAHVFAHEYGGGRWQVRCEGKEDLISTIAGLASPLAIEFSEKEKKDTGLQYQRVMAELRHMAETNEPHHCLLLLDNIDKPHFLEPVQVQRIPAEEWLHVIVTTRLGEGELYGRQKDRVFLPVDELPEADAIALIESYQPHGAFSGEGERQAAREIADLLGRFTLAVETTAVYLGQYSNDVTCSGYLSRLKKEGLTVTDVAAEQTSEGVRHGEKSMTVTLSSTLERLTVQERYILSLGALLPADYIALPWVRALASKKFPDLEKDADPGYPDSWSNLLRRLLSMRLFHLTTIKDASEPLQIVRMHRIVQGVVMNYPGENTDTLRGSLIKHSCIRSIKMSGLWYNPSCKWEIPVMLAFVEQIADQGNKGAHRLITSMCEWLPNSALNDSLRLLRKAAKLEEFCDETGFSEKTTRLTTLGLVLRQLGNFQEAEEVLREVVKMHEEAEIPDEGSYAISLNNLAKVILHSGRASEAVLIAKRSLEICYRTKMGDSVTASLLNNLGDALLASQCYQEAEVYMHQAISLIKKCYGETHPQNAVCMVSLARLCLNTDRHTEAGKYILSALPLLLDFFGAKHFRVADALEIKAEILKKDYREKEAYETFMEVLEIRKEVLSPDHPDIKHTENRILEFTNIK